MFETIKVFRGDRTAPLTTATEVVPTTDESTGGCTNGFESYTFRLDAGLYNVVVVGGGRKSKPLFFLVLPMILNETIAHTQNMRHSK
jgi:hypothetical protein